MVTAGYSINTMVFHQLTRTDVFHETSTCLIPKYLLTIKLLIKTRLQQPYPKNYHGSSKRPCVPPTQQTIRTHHKQSEHTTKTKETNLKNPKKTPQERLTTRLTTRAARAATTAAAPPLLTFPTHAVSQPLPTAVPPSLTFPARKPSGRPRPLPRRLPSPSPCIASGRRPSCTPRAAGRSCTAVPLSRLSRCHTKHLI